MATSSSGDREERGEEREEEGEGDSGGCLVCESCGYRQFTSCENCGKLLCQTKVNVARAENVQVVEHQVQIYRGHFTDYSRGKDKPTCTLKRTGQGDLNVEKTKTLILPQRQTIINLDPHGYQVKVNVADDPDSLEDATDSVFMLKSDWTSTAPGPPCSSAQGTEILLTQVINDTSSDLFLRVLEEIMKADLPESVIRRLYEKFRLRLLGLTKSLEWLLEVEAARVPEMMRRHVQNEIQQELAQLVPQGQREEVTWRDFSHFPVQCSDEVQRQGAGESLPHEVEEDSPETVRGAIDLACQFGNPETLRRLLDHRSADVTARNTRGQSPFHITCRYGHSHLLDLLLDKGAAIHEPDRDGWSPLHHAFGPDVGGEGKRQTTVRWLLDHGADTSVINADGRTPMDLAKLGGYGSTLELLVNDPRLWPPP